MMQQKTPDLNLLLCSRNDLVRRRWASALSAGWRTSQAAFYQEAVNVLERADIELVLLHRSMVDEAQLREICGRGVKVFVFSDRPADLEGAACLRAGCIGYANAYIAPARLVAAVEAVASGLAWVGTSLMLHLIRNLGHHDDSDRKNGRKATDLPELAVLTPRERQLAGLVADGLQNGAIAEQLGISERTVKAHLSSIYAKTGTKGRLSLALLVNKG